MPDDQRADQRALDAAEPAERDDDEGGQRELRARRRVHGIGEHQQRARRADARRADAERRRVDALHVDAHQRRRDAILRDGAHRAPGLGVLDEREERRGEHERAEPFDERRLLDARPDRDGARPAAAGSRTDRKSLENSVCASPCSSTSNPKVPNTVASGGPASSRRTKTR